MAWADGRQKHRLGLSWVKEKRERGNEPAGLIRIEERKMVFPFCSKELERELKSDLREILAMVWCTPNSRQNSKPRTNSRTRHTSTIKVYMNAPTYQ